MSRTDRLTSEDAEKLTAALDAVRAAQLDLRELTLGFERRYDLRDGDQVRPSGKIVRAPDG